MPNPLGLAIQAQTLGFNRQALLDHVRAADYLTCSVLDDLTLAIDLHIPYAVFRSYPFEPTSLADNDGAAREAAKTAMAKIRGWVQTHPGGRDVLYQVNCEQGFSLTRNRMYAYMIEDAANDPGGTIGLVVGNYASGAIKAGQGNEPNQWLTEAEPLLRALDKYRDKRLSTGAHAFVLGEHYYTGLFPWISANGGAHRLNPRWEDRPLAIDWNRAQWHLGRGLQGILKACQVWGIQPPPMLITECLIDDMDDVAYTFGSRNTGDTGLKLAAGYKKARGWRSLIPQWGIWYPGRDAAEVLADMTIWSWETIYAPLGFVIGTHTYCYGDGSQAANQWISFRVDLDDGKGYRKKMESYRSAPKPATGPLPEALFLDLADTRWTTADAVAIGTPALTFIRTLPSAAASKLEQRITEKPLRLQVIPKGLLDDAERAKLMRPDGYWHHVKLPDNQVGYVREDVVAMTSVVPVETPPVSPNSGGVTRAEVLALLEALKREFEALLAKDYVSKADLLPVIGALAGITHEAIPSARSLT